MKNYLSNPFSEAYVTHTVSEDHFVRFFSPVLVEPACAIFQTGNVVVRGTQGSGKSMLLRLLDPEIRIAYFEAQSQKTSSDVEFPVPPELRKFIASRVDLNKSGLLDIANTLPNSPTFEDIGNLVRSFADFFNYWLLRGLLLCVEKISENPDAFEGLVNFKQRDAFALSLARQDCWFNALDNVSDWDALKQAVKQRVVAYRAWANGNSELPNEIERSRTVIGEPLARAAEQLKVAGVIESDTNVLMTIDQLEALWMQGESKRELGRRLRREIHEFLGKRDHRVSYRIGVRRYDWGKEGSLAMRDGRDLEEGRDYRSIDIDELLRRGENSKGWAFKKLAKDVFQRRVRTVLSVSTEMTGSSTSELSKTQAMLEQSHSFFGPSPTPQEVVAAAIRNPDPTGDRLLKLDSEWPDDWRAAIMSCYRKEVPEIPRPPVEDYPFDPLNALLLSAWGMQTGGKRKSKFRRHVESPPQSVDEVPWNKAKQYWRKERYPQAVLQLISRHQQKMLWWGEEKVLSLCGSNILRFITICRETWDYWQRLTDDPLQTVTDVPAIVPPDVQAQAIFEASRKVYEALKRQPGRPAGDVRIRFLDGIASWLRSRLLEDIAMSNPGGNGFSLRVSDLKKEKYQELRLLIEEAVGWGDLYEMDHTSKMKTERAKEPRKKYYINPMLSPFYQLPDAHTKEPVYANINDIQKIAEKERIISTLPQPQKTDAVENKQLSLFQEEP